MHPNNIALYQQKSYISSLLEMLLWYLSMPHENGCLPNGKEELLGMAEGKDNYNALHGLLNEYISCMVKHETKGIVVNGELFLIKYHWGGDLVFILNLVGLQSASCKFWCPDCLQAGTGGEWWMVGAPRNLTAERDGLIQKQYVANRVFTPIIHQWLSTGRIHYCSLHANLSLAKAMIRAFVNRAVSEEATDDAIKNALNITWRFEVLAEKYGTKLDQVSDSREAVLDFQNFLRNTGRTFSNMDIEELTNEIITINDHNVKKLSDVIHLYESAKVYSDGDHRVLRLQYLLDKRGISISIVDCLVADRAPSVIGDHTLILLDIVEEIGEIIQISDKELELFKKLRRVVRVLLRTDPEEEDVLLFLNEGDKVFRDFVSSFELNPWNYCHLITSHMREDMKRLRDQKMTISMFSASRIENLGCQLKRILKLNTNHRMNQQHKLTEHCIIQAIRYFYWVRDCEEELRGQSDSDEPCIVDN